MRDSRARSARIMHSGDLGRRGVSTDVAQVSRIVRGADCTLRRRLVERTDFSLAHCRGLHGAGVGALRRRRCLIAAVSTRSRMTPTATSASSCGLYAAFCPDECPKMLNFCPNRSIIPRATSPDCAACRFKSTVSGAIDGISHPGGRSMARRIDNIFLICVGASVLCWLALLIVVISLLYG